MACARRAGIQRIPADLKANYASAVKKGLLVWVPMQYINFRCACSACPPARCGVSVIDQLLRTGMCRCSGVCSSLTLCVVSRDGWDSCPCKIRHVYAVCLLQRGCLSIWRDASQADSSHPH